MCLLIWKPADKNIDDNKYRNAHNDNPDGCGIAYVDNDRLVIQKGMWKLDEFLDKVKLVGNREMLIHFRAASPNMDKNQEMCHPFWFASDMIKLKDSDEPRFEFALGHNGRLDYQCSKTVSDTAAFTAEVVSPLLSQNPWALDFPPTVFLMEQFMKKENKILILRWDRQEKELTKYILNEQGGFVDKKAHFLDGIWFSNESYLPRKFPKSNVYSSYGTVYVNGQPFQTGSEEYYSKFSMPDEHGWVWSYEHDMWKNQQTGAFAKDLQTRPEKPYYMQQREQQEANKGSKKKDTANKKSSIPIDEDFDLTDDRAWAAFCKQSGVSLKEAFDYKNATNQNLTKRERRIVRRASIDYVNANYDDTAVLAKGGVSFTFKEMLALMRDDFRNSHPNSKQYDDDIVDLCIIGLIKKGHNITSIIKNTYEEEKESASAIK